MVNKFRGEDRKWAKIGLNSEKLGDSLDGSLCKIFDICLFSRDRFQVLNILEDKLILGTKKYWIATVNPEFVMAARKDASFKKVLEKTDLNVIDGIGLVWAREVNETFMVLGGRLVRKILYGVKVGMEVLRGKYKDQVASGADLILELARMAKEKNKKIFLLGGWEGRAEKTAQYLKSRFLIPGNQIEWCEGEPKVENKEVVKRINRFKPDILLVAYGMKKQEFWIGENLNKVNVGIVMGVGRSFDYYSGDLKRASKWIQKMGLEWLYSLIKEPKRFKRQLALPKFIWAVLNK